MLSTMGGMNVEEIAEKDPDALVRRHIEPDNGFGDAEAGALASAAGVAEDARKKTAAAPVKLHRAFNKSDATLIEVNPLVVTKDHDVVALDSKVTIDNSALFRHEELADLEEGFNDQPVQTGQEQQQQWHVQRLQADSDRDRGRVIGVEGEHLLHRGPVGWRADRAHHRVVDYHQRCRCNGRRAHHPCSERSGRGGHRRCRCLFTTTLPHPATVPLDGPVRHGLLGLAQEERKPPVGVRTCR